MVHDSPPILAVLFNDTVPEFDDHIVIDPETEAYETTIEIAKIMSFPQTFMWNVLAFLFGGDVIQNTNTVSNINAYHMPDRIYYSKMEYVENVNRELGDHQLVFNKSDEPVEDLARILEDIAMHERDRAMRPNDLAATRNQHDRNILSMNPTTFRLYREIMIEKLDIIRVRRQDLILNIKKALNRESMLGEDVNVNPKSLYEAEQEEKSDDLFLEDLANRLKIKSSKKSEEENQENQVTKSVHGVHHRYNFGGSVKYRFTNSTEDDKNGFSKYTNVHRLILIHNGDRQSLDRFKATLKYGGADKGHFMDMIEWFKVHYQQRYQHLEALGCHNGYVKEMARDLYCGKQISSWLANLCTTHRTVSWREIDLLILLKETVVFDIY